MKRIIATLLLPLAVLAIGQSDCESEPTPHPDAGPDTTVVAFDAIHQSYGSENTRSVRAEVAFPAEGLKYESITMHYALACPEGGCDPWDRTAYINVIDETVDPALSVEVGRVITPYGVGYAWSMDVTELRPILTGTKVVESFIDTWVNPGWLVDVSFEFVGGVPDREATHVIPLQRGYYTYGNPADPIDNHLLPVDVTIPDSATDAVVRVLATGHGFGYTENCAEFCPKEHTLSLGSVTDTATPWRDDCARAGAPDQAGTYWYSRAGWCPGDMVYPRTWEVGENLLPGNTQQFGYALQPYENDVEGGNPYIIISAYLVLFE